MYLFIYEYTFIIETNTFIHPTHNQISLVFS